MNAPRSDCKFPSVTPNPQSARGANQKKLHPGRTSEYKHRVSQEGKFWHWFLKHEQELFNLDSNPEPLFTQLISALSRVDRDLTFEIGPGADKRELVISAGGIKRAFPAVSRLVQAAPPQLARWTITAFRPRTPLPITLEIEGKRVSSEDVQFSLLENGSVAGIRLFIHGYNEQSTLFKQFGYLLLDAALGEYDVETGLGFIQMLPPEESTSEHRYPFADLPELFDQLIARLGKRSGIPC
ncbi:MAG TPA: hypothetical protein VHE33_03545 [Acidobacteriaceae bacterium]|nr:hypothetical protein [Acidobacteriaceae bacterium]